MEGLADAAAENAIDLTVIGPEAPLAAGIGDEFARRGLRLFGPTAAAAELEASKVFAKEFCLRHSIPTAAAEVVRTAAETRKAVQSFGLPVVLKADGLAAGKGVAIAETHEDAAAFIAECFEGKFGSAGASVVIEEFLSGEEASFFVLSDGKEILPLATAQDHKRVGDGDTGPNTGGMGAYSPAPVMTDALVDETLSKIIKPTIAKLPVTHLADARNSKSACSFRNDIQIVLVNDEENGK